MNRRFPMMPVAATGEVQGGRQRSPHMIEGRVVPYLRVANVFDGYIDFRDINEMHFKLSEIENFRLKSGDILLNEGQSVELVGRCAMYIDGPEDCCFQNTLIRYRAGPETDENFAVQLFRYCQAIGVFSKIAVKTNSIAHLGVSRFAELELPFPPLPEQQKIAEILRTWDEAIEKLEALRAAKERRLHSLRAKLTYVDAEGEPTRLGDVTEEGTTRNGEGRLGREMVMGVTNSRGIVPMREQTIAEDISRYKVVPQTAFAYNPMRINVGSIAMNEGVDPILVSPDYVVFSCVRGKFLPDFLDHLKNTKWWAHYINSGGSGTVRQRTYYADLAAMRVPLPNFDQQRRIADILNTAWRDVTATTRKITALQRQKRGLMQKLLTGEWRVKVEAN